MKENQTTQTEVRISTNYMRFLTDHVAEYFMIYETQKSGKFSQKNPLIKKYAC